MREDNEILLSRAKTRDLDAAMNEPISPAHRDPGSEAGATFAPGHLFCLE
jgi:hypothetical protein